MQRVIDIKVELEMFKVHIKDMRTRPMATFGVIIIIFEDITQHGKYYSEPR